MLNFPHSHYITARTVRPGHCPGTRYLFTARDSQAVLIETVATVSLSTDIHKCRRTETALYAPTQRSPRDGHSWARLSWVKMWITAVGRRYICSVLR